MSETAAEQTERHNRAAQELWRLHGPRRVTVAVLHSTGPVSELRVFYEPEALQNVLAREFGSDRRLLRRAASMREELLKQGWIELGRSDTSQRGPWVSGKRVAAAGTVLATIAAVWAWRRRLGR